MYRLTLWFRDRRNKIWMTPALAVVVGMLASLGASIANDLFDPDSVPSIERETIDGLLEILAASMLTVATFSLGIMVSAFAFASSNATPRATELVMADDGTRRAISAFIGAFVYAVVARTALSIEIYGPVGRFVLFVATALVLLYVVTRLVLWVRTMSTLGRLSDTLERVEEATRRALEQHVRTPYLGGRVGGTTTPAGRPIRCNTTGYLTHVDRNALQDLAESVDGTCHVRLRPGAFVDPTTVLAIVERGADGGDCSDSEIDETVRSAFVTGRHRSYDQDPRFGFIVFSEVAQRALSPAVNDPGTAIQVSALVTALLVDASQVRASMEPESPSFERLTVVDLDEGEFVTDAFGPIARDGAGSLELAIRIQEFLAVIRANVGGAAADAATREAERSLALSTLALELDHDRDQLARRHHALFTSP